MHIHIFERLAFYNEKNNLLMLSMLYLLNNIIVLGDELNLSVDSVSVRQVIIGGA